MTLYIYNDMRMQNGKPLILCYYAAYAKQILGFSFSGIKS